MNIALAPDGKVAIVVFLDPQGPFDARAYSTLKEVANLYPSDLSVDYQYFPMPMHRNAEIAAEALIAAQAQGKRSAMSEFVFAHQTALQRADLERYAAQAGLDLGRFKEAMDSGAGRTVIEASMAAGRKWGVVGTPVIVLDNRKLIGTQTVSDLTALIDAELKTDPERLTRLQGRAVLPTRVVGDLERAKKKGLSTSVFGLPLGKPLAVPDCPDESRPENSACVRRCSPTDSSCKELVAFPFQKLPLWAGDLLFVDYDGSSAVGFWGHTLAGAGQADTDMRTDLQAKYGPPTTMKTRKLTLAEDGAVGHIDDWDWVLPGLHVEMHVMAITSDLAEAVRRGFGGGAYEATFVFELESCHAAKKAKEAAHKAADKASRTKL